MSARDDAKGGRVTCPFSNCLITGCPFEHPTHEPKET